MENTFKKSTLVLFLGSFLIFTACQKESEVPQSVQALDLSEHPEIDTDDFEDNNVLEIADLYREPITQHVEGHGVNLDGIERIDYPLPDGSVEQKLLVDGCIAMTEEELHDVMIQTSEKIRQ